MEQLVLIGAGGFARETVELVGDINDAHPRWDLIGFLDDDERLHGSTIAGVPVLGAISDAVRSQAKLTVCVGHPGNYSSRERIVRQLGLATSRYATLVHPTTVLGRTVTIGVGSVVHALCVATCDVVIGSHVAVMPGSIFTHDDFIADYATVGAGARIAGNVRIGHGAYVGSGAMIREGRVVGAGSLIGMGSVVTTDVPSQQVWVGSPARYLRPADTVSASPSGIDGGF